MLVYVIFLALFVKWLNPSFWGLSSSILLGAVLGLAYSFWHAWNKKQREDIRGLVRALPPPIEPACELRILGMCTLSAPKCIPNITLWHKWHKRQRL